jgi:hypothetical protein
MHKVYHDVDFVYRAGAPIATSVASATTAGFRAWPRVVAHRCHHDGVVRLTAARENGTEFDLPAALRQVRPDASRGTAPK